MYHGNMSNASVIIIVLLIVIAVMGWLLMGKPAEAPTIPVATTSQTSSNPIPNPTTSPGPVPLHEKIVVTYPKANAIVPKKFTVTGRAPGNWFFEAQAPALVQAPDGTKIAQGQMRAQGEWMTTELVDFTAELTINQTYSG